MSRPPALDPDAERWAARFDTLQPPAPDEAARKRSGRWKTQAMGSMVPIEVASARQDLEPLSEAAPSQLEPRPTGRPLPARATSLVEEREIPMGFSPQVNPAEPHISQVRDSVLQRDPNQTLTLAVSGARGSDKGRFASALALALANSGVRVLLVEADFDNPQVHQALGIQVPMGTGFSQQLAARRQDPRERPWLVLHCSQNLQVLAEGRLRSPGLLPSAEFEGAVADLSAAYPVVVIHAPAIEQRTEVLAISPLVQAAVLAKPGAAPRLQFGANPFAALI